MYCNRTNDHVGAFSRVSQIGLYDFDRDGRADMIAMTYDGDVVVRRSTSTGMSTTFQDHIVHRIRAQGFGDGALVVDDFDNDGRPDLFSYTKGSGYVVYMPNVPDPSAIYAGEEGWLRPRDRGFKIGWTANALASWDFNGDGYKDIVYHDQRGRVWVLWNRPWMGNRRFIHEELTLLFQDLEVGTYANETADSGGVVDVADLNGDGLPDIIASNTWRSTINIYLGKQGAGGIYYDVNEKFQLVNPSAGLGSIAYVDSRFPNSKAPNTLPSFKVSVIKVVDVDSDGIPDIMVGTEGARYPWGASVYLFKGTDRMPNGLPRFLSLEMRAGGSGQDFDGGWAGDVNGDGFPDFIAGDGNNSGNYTVVMMRTTGEYSTDFSILVLKSLRELFGLAPNEFIRTLQVHLAFNNYPDWMRRNYGTFFVRYMKNLANPYIEISSPSNPNAWMSNSFDFRHSYPVQGYYPQGFIATIHADGAVNFSSWIDLRQGEPLLPPTTRVLIALRPANPQIAPAISRISIEIRTERVPLSTLGFRWLRKGT